jgi:hypothetical protein
MPRKNLLSLHEAIVIALINQPNRTATFEEIADYIEQRNLYPERKGNIPLSTQVMLRSTKAKGVYHHLFEELGANYIKLRDGYADFPLKLNSALEEILEPFKHFFQPPYKKMNVVDPEWGSNKKIELSSRNIICATSQGRKKTIYVYQPGLDEKMSIKKYTVQESLEKLRKKVDPLSHRLVIVSRDALLNVAYFAISSQQILKTSISDPVKEEWPSFKFSASKKAKEYFENFVLVQTHYANFTLLQKSILGYKSDFDLR